MDRIKKLLDKYRTMPIQIKASFWFFICAFLQKGISIITTPIFTRLLTTAEYGHYNVFNSWYGIAQIIVTLNLSYGVYTQGLIKYDKDKNIFSSSLLGLTTTLVFVWTVVYCLFHGLINNLLSLTTEQVFMMLLMTWTTTVFNFWSSEQRVLYRYRNLVILTVSVSIAKPILGIFFVCNFDDKVTSRILAIILVEFIGYIGLFVSQYKRGKTFISLKYWKYAILYNLPLIPHYLAQTVLSTSDRVMISNFIGDSEAGIYSLAYSVSLLMTLFNTALLQTLNPWMFQKIKDKKIDRMVSIGYGSLILISALNLGLIIVAPEVIMVFAPSDYYDAIWVIPPVALSVVFMFGYEIFAKFAFYYEKTSFVMISTIVAAALNIVLNMLFVPKFGYVAAGYTTLCCYICYFWGHYYFMNKICKMYLNGIKPYSFWKILIITTTTIIIGVLFNIAYFYPAIRYIIMIGLIIALILLRRKLLAAFSAIMAMKREG